MTKTLIVSMPACGKTTLVKDLNSTRDHFDSTAVDVDIRGLRFTETDDRVPYTQLIAGLLSAESRYSVITSFTGSIDWRYLSKLTLPHELRIVFALPSVSFEEDIVERVRIRDGHSQFYSFYAENIHRWNFNARMEYNLAADLGFLVSLEELDVSRPYLSEVYQALDDFPCVVKSGAEVDSRLVYGCAYRWLLEAYESDSLKYYCASKEVQKLIEGTAEFNTNWYLLRDESRDEYQSLAMAFVVAALVKFTTLNHVHYLTILRYCAGVVGVTIDKFTEKMNKWYGIRSLTEYDKV